MIKATKSSFAYKSSSIHLHCHSVYTLQLHFKVSEMFGGLDICSLEAVVAKDGREVSLIITTTTIPILLIIINLLCISSCLICQYFFQVIIEVNDCALSLMGESQEEDRRHMADLVLAKMEEKCGLMPQELMVRLHVVLVVVVVRVVVVVMLVVVLVVVK